MRSLVSASLGLALGAVQVGGCSSKPARPNAVPTIPPQRIVTIAPNAAEIVAALGAADRLVGVSEFCVYPPALTALPKVGGLFNPDLEAILNLKPDLVIVRGSVPEVERLCRTSGIRLYQDPTEKLEDIFTTIRQLGAILDRREAADALEKKMRSGIAQITTAVEGLPRPRVFFSIARDPSSLSRVSSAGAGTFVDSLITLAGGENIFGHLEVAYPEISLEAILTAQPDVIIEAMPEKKLTGDLKRQVVQQWRSLGRMPATRDGHIYILTSQHLLIPSPRVVGSIAMIADLLHPGVLHGGRTQTQEAGLD